MNKNTIGFVLIIVLLSAASVISLNLFFRQESDRDAIDIHAFPHAVGDWKGKDLEITEKEYEMLETRNLILRVYKNSAGEKLHLFIIYSETNRSVFHPPEVCLIGGGITITDKKIEKISFNNRKFFSNKLYLEKNNKREIALYCYKSGNLYTDNYYLQQAHFTLNQLLGKQRGGATIRISMAMGESEKATLSKMKNFMSKAIDILENLS